MTTYARFSSSPVTIAFTTLLAAITACTAVDDDPSEPAEADSDTDDLTPGEECRAAAEEFMCSNGESFVAHSSSSSVPELTLVPADDPDAALELPGGVLVEVSSVTEFVGSNYFGNSVCSMRCSWCEPGQSLCHTGLTDTGSRGCGVCMPFDTPDIVEQCTEMLEVCNSIGQG